MLHLITPNSYQLILFITFVVFTLLIASVLFYFYVQHTKTILYDDISKQANVKFESQQQRLDEIIEHAHRHLTTIADDTHFKRFVDDKENRDEYRKIARIISSFLRSGHDLDMIRYIENTGDELIRIDRLPNGEIIVEENLQNKRNRYYFQEAMQLNKGEFYVSDFDLNVENEKIEVPYVPTIRIAVPVFSKNSRKGVLIVNLRADDVFKPRLFKDLFDLYIVDQNGYFLLHPESEKSWSGILETGHRYPGLTLGSITLDEVQKFDHVYAYLLTGTRSPIYLMAKAKEEILTLNRNEIRKNVTKVLFIVLLFSVTTALIVSSVLSKIYRTLQERNLQLQEALDILDEHIIYSETDLQGNITAASTAFAKISGYSKEELIGRPHSIIRHPENPPELYESMWNTISAGKTWQCEMKNFSKEGETYYVYTTVKPKYDLKGNHIGYISVRFDTTPNKEIQSHKERLVYQSRHAIMGEMISIIAHQWKQPLNHLSAEIYSLYKEAHAAAQENRKIDAHFESSEKLLMHLSDLITTFKRFFEPQNAKQDFPMAQAVESALKLVDPALAKQRVEVTTRNEAADEMIHGVENEISQAIVNIIQNALEEFERRKTVDPKIELKIHKVGKKIILQICDNAGGIDEESIPKLFNPYFTTKGEEGTGLGLYLVSLIVEDKLKGEITAENGRVGLCVTIRIPYS
jgi:PAS domain S-box-containing protein